MATYQYPKTTGECVTVKYNEEIQLLDTALSKLTPDGIRETIKEFVADMKVGSFMWFMGPSDKKPYRTLVCDGSAVSRTTFAKLFAVIGTTYGAGNGSTTFNLPNLLDAGDDGNLGRFIRATGDNSKIGTKESDAIRNITGFFGFNSNGGKTGIVTGAGSYGGALFVTSFTSGVGQAVSGGSGWSCGDEVAFDASNVVPTINENRPINISLLPLISY